jgi:adenosylcobyric acid synthase
MAAEGYDGVASTDGRVWGTYLHGLFDSDDFRRWWLKRIGGRSGKGVLGGETDNRGTAANGTRYDDRFDALAAAVRKAIDVEQLYRIIWS